MSGPLQDRRSVQRVMLVQQLSLRDHQRNWFESEVRRRNSPPRLGTQFQRKILSGLPRLPFCRVLHNTQQATFRGLQVLRTGQRATFAGLQVLQSGQRRMLRALYVLKSVQRATFAPSPSAARGRASDVRWFASLANGQSREVEGSTGTDRAPASDVGPFARG